MSLSAARLAGVTATGLPLYHPDPDVGSNLSHLQVVYCRLAQVSSESAEILSIVVELCARSILS
ncbi:MAG: hypothetical protein ABI670_19075 [Chloroflexota bacterium]